MERWLTTELCLSDMVAALGVFVILFIYVLGSICLPLREGDDRGWDGWMASPTQWTGVWVNSGSWWQTGRPGVLQSMGSQRVGHDWATELNWNTLLTSQFLPLPLPKSSLPTYHWCWTYFYLQSFSNFTGNRDDRGVCQCSVILPDNTFPVLRVERLEITAQTISRKFEKELSKVSIVLFLPLPTRSCHAQTTWLFFRTV